jgi:shikimate 5-dehydrogenase
VVPAGVEAADILAALQATDIRALVIAQEFQEVVGQALDGLEPAACRVGRVNLIELRDGELVGGWFDHPDEVVARLAALTVPA